MYKKKRKEKPIIIILYTYDIVIFVFIFWRNFEIKAADLLLYNKMQLVNETHTHTIYMASIFTIFTLKKKLQQKIRKKKCK